MNIFENGFDLANSFSELTLQQRQSGLIDSINMKWNDSNQFKLTQQYKQIYLSRLQKLNNRFEHLETTPIAQVTQDHDKYTIKGIIKRLEVTRVRAFEKHFTTKYGGENSIYSESDEMEIQDKTGKLKFVLTSQATIDIPNVGKIKATHLPSGILVAFVGKFKKTENLFKVKSIILPTMAPQSTYRMNFINEQMVNFTDKTILVASEPSTQLLERIKDIISNSCNQAMNIIALVLIGGIELKAQSITHFAAVVQQLKDIIDVFVMPSSGHQRQSLFPLQPYNGLFFSKSQMQISLCSNPQLFQAQNGLKLHISCGQNVIDFMKNCQLASNELQVLESMIRFSHFCPTSPFSLKTQPYTEDHLVVEEMPHIMISGKAKTFGSRLKGFGQGKQVLFISIPKNNMGLVSLNGQGAKQLI